MRQCWLDRDRGQSPGRQWLVLAMGWKSVKVRLAEDKVTHWCPYLDRSGKKGGTPTILLLVAFGYYFEWQSHVSRNLVGASIANHKRFKSKDKKIKWKWNIIPQEAMNKPFNKVEVQQEKVKTYEAEIGTHVFTLHNSWNKIHFGWNL